MIKLKYFLLLLILLTGCRDKNTETQEYPDVNNLDEILSYSIPDNAEEVKGPPASDNSKAVDYMLNGQLIGRKTYYSNGNIAAEVLQRHQDS